MSVRTWLAGLPAIVALTRTRGVVRGGFTILPLTLLVARVAYLRVSAA